MFWLELNQRDIDKGRQPTALKAFLCGLQLRHQPTRTFVESTERKCVSDSVDMHEFVASCEVWAAQLVTILCLFPKIHTETRTHARTHTHPNPPWPNRTT